MSLGESIRAGTKWLVLGRAGNRLMEFAFGVILARLLVPADFGMIATITVFTGFVGMFTSGGMSQSLIRAKEAGVDDFTAVFTLQLGMGILVYAAFFVTAPWIAAFFEEPLYTDLIRVSTLSFLLRPFLATRNAWLNREMHFKGRTMVDVISGAFTGAASCALAFAGLGVWSLTLSGLLGGLLKNLCLARLSPVQPRLNLNLAVMRKHSGYGSRIVASDFLSYLRTEAKNLIISKVAGPGFLGLFNKAESMSRLPNQLLMAPTMEPLFRAMSKTQDNRDLSRYLFYRTITLLTAYTTPVYVVLWWVAEPFIGVVYGRKWIEAGAAMSILCIAGVVLNVIFPCGVVMASENRLGSEMVAKSLNLIVVVTACLIGIHWGLKGVAWGIVLSHFVYAFHMYWLAQSALDANLGDLWRAVYPGITLSAMVFLCLALTDCVLDSYAQVNPFVYLLVMGSVGGLFHTCAFLFVPFTSLASETARWRNQVRHLVRNASGLRPR